MSKWTPPLLSWKVKSQHKLWDLSWEVRVVGVLRGECGGSSFRYPLYHCRTKHHRCNVHQTATATYGTPHWKFLFKNFNMSFNKLHFILNVFIKTTTPSKNLCVCRLCKGSRQLQYIMTNARRCVLCMSFIVCGWVGVCVMFVHCCFNFSIPCEVVFCRVYELHGSGCFQKVLFLEIFFAGNWQTAFKRFMLRPAVDESMML